MPRTRSARSDVSDVDIEGLQEQELVNLKRRLRNMEEDRSAYAEETKTTVERQSAKIKKLKSEKQELLIELRLADSRANQSKDEEHIDTLVTLVEAKDKTEEDIKQEQETQKELDVQIKECEKKVKEQRKNMGGANMSSEHSTQSEKKQRVLSDRLDQQKKLFANCLAENAILRDDIESHRTENRRFVNLHRKLEDEMQKLNVEKAELIESATNLYDQRDEAQAKNIILKEKSDKDIQQHNAEMKELLRIIDHDRKLREFMGIKGQERQADPQLIAWKQQKAIKREKKRESREDSVETYEEAFTRIKAMTGEDDIDVLVYHFIEVEDTNFALFNYVNEQNNQMENLSDQINEMKENIENFQQDGMQKEANREELMRDLEIKTNKASKEAEEFENKYKEVSKILDQLKAGIDSLFTKMNCDRTPIDELLGSSEEVTDENVLQHMGIIEQKTNELLAVQAYVNSKDPEKYDPKAPRLLGEGPDQPYQAQPIHPPAIGDEYESEVDEDVEEEARPYSREELSRRAMKVVKKREFAAAKEEFKYDLSRAKEKLAKKKEGRK